MANIVPAILTNDISQAQAQLNQVSGLVELAQIDLMDGKFVSNTSITPEEVQHLKSSIELEAHLMVNQPELWLPYLDTEIFKRIYFHIEAVKDPAKLISSIKDKEIEPGIAINLETPIEAMANCVGTVDSVLFMAIKPGWQGQAFQSEVLNKIDEFINQYPDHLVALDGGVSESNIQSVVKVGVYNISIGSAIFGNGNVKENINKLKELI